MWNDLRTDEYEGMLAETISLNGADGARSMPICPTARQRSFPGVVLIPHMPADEFYRETARRFAQHGYLTVCPDNSAASVRHAE
jgi:carboxymethylenebutenolidase